MRRSAISHRLTEFIPAELDEGIVYVSIEYATASHLCCCGCGEKVVTPMTPTDWKIIFNGEAVSLHPSIGNWGFECRSHYWIKEDRVVWADNMTDQTVKNIRRLDRKKKDRFYRNNPVKEHSWLKNFIKWCLSWKPTK